MDDVKAFSHGIRRTAIPLQGLLGLAIAASCAVGLAGLADAGAPGTVREVAAYRTETPPVVDGSLVDKAWATAAKADSVITAFGLRDGWGPADDRVTAYVTYDEHALYVAIVNASIPEPAPVLAAQADQASLVLQVMLDPGHFHAVGGWLWVSSDGEVVQNGFRDARSISAASRFSEAGWTVELAIPFVEWGGMPLPGAIWGFDIGGAFGRGGERPTWQPTFGPYAQPGRWGHLRFAGPPSVDGGPVTPGTAWPSVRTARAFRVEEPPELDGRIDDAVWAAITRSGGVLTGFVQHEGDRLAELPLYAALAYDAENLYVYVRSDRVPGAPLSATSDGSERKIWDRDQVELMLSPGKGGQVGWWIVVDAMGHSQVRSARLWGDLQSVQAETRIAEDAWTLEMRVPFSLFATEAPDPGEIWRFNVGGHRVETGEWPTWEPTGGPYEWVDRWGRLEFVDMPE